MRKDLELRKKCLEQFQASERNFNASLQQILKEMAKTKKQGFMMIASMFQH